MFKRSVTTSHIIRFPRSLNVAFSFFPLGAFYVPASYHFFIDACNIYGAFINTELFQNTGLIYEIYVSIYCESRDFPPKVRLAMKPSSPWGF